MLSFCTEFPVERGDIESFCRSVAQWRDGSPHSSLTGADVLEIATSDTNFIKRGDEELTCRLFEEGRRVSAGFQHKLIQSGVEWITTACFDSDEFASWVSVRTERTANDAVPFLPDAKKPFIVRNLMGILGGGVDGELRVSDDPHILSDNDRDMVVRLLNGDSEHHLPFIYISHPFDGNHIVDFVSLAKHLGGIAHILVEPSRDFSIDIQKEVFSENPYGGYIGIYYSSQKVQKFPPSLFVDDFTLRKEIYSNIRSSLLNRRPLIRCSWSNIQTLLSRRDREFVRADAPDAVREYVQAFDAEMEAKDLQIAEAEAEIARLRSELILENRQSRASRDLTLSLGGEQQLTDNEFHDIVIDALAVQVNNLTGRREEVLRKILDNNQPFGHLSRKREFIKALLRGYRSMTPEIRGSLVQMGFTFSEEGKHIKLTYRGDGRYTFILSKSASDHRTGLNTAGEISRSIF